MAGEWQRYAVKALIDNEILLIGDGYRAKNQELASSGLPFARAGNINNGFRFDDADCFPEVHIARVGNKISQPGDVVFTSKGTVGRFAFVRPDTPRFVYSPQLCFWRPLNTDVIEPRFLYYWMHGREFFIQFKGVAGQTDMAEYVSLSDQRRMHISLPPIAEQRAIAHILGTLDDKIELNRKQNETLEAMARALFKAWFVDFEPVRAKMEGRWQRGQSLPGLPVHLYDLFPDRLVESELGEIPEGWEWVPASRLIEFNPPEPLRKGTVAPYIEMSALPTSGSWPEPPVLRPFGSGMRFHNGDTLLARITPCLENGKTAFVQCLPDNEVGWGSTEFIVMRPRHPVPKEFGYLLARDEAFRAHAIRSMTGTSGRQRVQADSVADFPVAMPSNEDLWQEFASVVSPAFKSIKANAEAVETLAQLRDTLLPKLISGELRIADAEKPMEKFSQ